MSDNRKAFEDEVQSFVSSQPEWRYADTEALWWFFWQAATEQSSKEIERLNALVAMKDEALKDLSIAYEAQGKVLPKYVVRAFSTSPESIAAWEAEKLLPLQKRIAELEEQLRK